MQLCECLTRDVNERFSTFLSGCSNLSCFGAKGSLFLLRTPPMPSPWFSSRCVSCLVSDFSLLRDSWGAHLSTGFDISLRFAFSPRYDLSIGRGSSLRCFLIGPSYSCFDLCLGNTSSLWFSLPMGYSSEGLPLGYSTRGLEYSSLGFVPSVSLLRSVSVFLRFLSRTSRPLASPKCCECSLVFL